MDFHLAALNSNLAIKSDEAENLQEKLLSFTLLPCATTVEKWGCKVQFFSQRASVAAFPLPPELQLVFQMY